MRIGVYCGSFDPIHTGHAMVANSLAQYGGLDEVWLMVSRHNPLKVGRDPASEPHRLAMVKLVAEGCSRVVASDFEFSLPVPSYTYVTLCRLRERFPQHKFVLIIGSDNWHNFNRWRDSESILREFGLIVYPRPGYDLPVELPAGVEVPAKAPQALISSTFIRKAVADGKNLNYFVPREVADYIRQNRLYTNLL